MKKETLLLSNIIQDLKIVIEKQLSNKGKWRFSFIVPITLISVILGVFLKNILIALLIFSVAVYHIVRYILEYRAYRGKYSAVMEVLHRADISISIEKLSHISAEMIYEPHFSFRPRQIGHSNTTKTVSFYYFLSGSQWRIPSVKQHYLWSKEYYLSSEGLENISLQGDEFYFVSLKDYPDIAYIYPCKIFVLEEKLKKDL